MMITSDLALFAARRLPRGYYKVVSMAARLDSGLRAHPVALKGLGKAEMVCDFIEPVFTEYLRHGLIPHQAGQDSIFRKLIEPGDLVFDVGANVGYTAMLFAQSVGCQGRVIAVEPGNRAFGYLDRNTKHNARVFSNIETLKVAVSDVSGEAQFFDAQMSQLSSLEYVDGAQPYTVPVKTIDELTSEYGFPDFVKIDVEGHEIKVFAGMRRTLVSDRPPIVIFEALAASERDLCLNVIQEINPQYAFFRISHNGDLVHTAAAEGTNDYLALPQWALYRLED